MSDHPLLEFEPLGQGGRATLVVDPAARSPHRRGGTVTRFSVDIGHRQCMGSQVPGTLRRRNLLPQEALRSRNPFSARRGGPDHNATKDVGRQGT